MKLFIIGAYTLLIAVVWWFFVLAKIHAFKFKDFSTSVDKVTLLLMTVLAILTVVGYWIIFHIDLDSLSLPTTWASSTEYY